MEAEINVRVKGAYSIHRPTVFSSALDVDS